MRKIWREEIFEMTIWNECSHAISNDSSVRLVNFATPINLVVRSKMFAHRNIHKYTGTVPKGKMHNETTFW
jgi:hypothetical protein